MVIFLSREKAGELVDGLYKKVDSYHLVENLESCLACGKCVGNCPVASLTPSYNPRQIIRDVLTGNMRRWLQSEEIWRCFWCAGCYTGCPVDIHYPMLVMQLRFRAIENQYGLKYFTPFKRFALRAREDALTFAPGAKGRERIMRLRTAMGVSPWPEVSEKAVAEYKALFDMTGTTEWLNAINDEDDKPVSLTYAAGRIKDEQS